MVRSIYEISLELMNTSETHNLHHSVAHNDDDSQDEERSSARFNITISFPLHADRFLLQYNRTHPLKPSYQISLGYRDSGFLDLTLVRVNSYSPLARTGGASNVLETFINTTRYAYRPVAVQHSSSVDAVVAVNVSSLNLQVEKSAITEYYFELKQGQTIIIRLVRNVMHKDSALNGTNEQSSTEGRISKSNEREEMDHRLTGLADADATPSSIENSMPRGQTIPFMEDVLVSTSGTEEYNFEYQNTMANTPTGSPLDTTSTEHALSDKDEERKRMSTASSSLANDRAKDRIVPTTKVPPIVPSLEEDEYGFVAEIPEYSLDVNFGSFDEIDNMTAHRSSESSSDIGNITDTPVADRIIHRSDRNFGNLSMSISNASCAICLRVKDSELFYVYDSIASQKAQQ